MDVADQVHNFMGRSLLLPERTDYNPFVWRTCPKLSDDDDDDDDDNEDDNAEQELWSGI